jgi:hypothetical protein
MERSLSERIPFLGFSLRGDSMNIEEQFRPPTATEAEIIQRLVAADFPGKKEIANQLRNYQVRTIDREGSLKLRLTGAAPAAKIEKAVPVQAEAPDSDGVHVHFLLHVVHGFAAELEIYKNDLSEIRRLPRADELEVIVLGK